VVFALDQRDILGLDLIEHEKPGGGLYTEHDNQPEASAEHQSSR